MVAKSFVLALVLLSAELCSTFDVKPVVTTSLGKIQGCLREFYPGKGKYEVYQGIPYALPPTGSRRFSVRLKYLMYFFFYAIFILNLPLRIVAA